MGFHGKTKSYNEVHNPYTFDRDDYNPEHRVGARYQDFQKVGYNMPVITKVLSLPEIWPWNQPKVCLHVYVEYQMASAEGGAERGLALAAYNKEALRVPEKCRSVCLLLSLISSLASVLLLFMQVFTHQAYPV